jgi:GDSL-like lipase/acylhydrolase family protein
METTTSQWRTTAGRSRGGARSTRHSPGDPAGRGRSSGKASRLLLLFAGLALTLSLVQRPAAGDDTARVPVYPTLAPDPDLVPVAPYDTIEAGAANWGTGLTGATHFREFITAGNPYRIRQSGTIRRIRLNLQEPTGLTGFYLRIWRKIGATYDVVGSSENLAPRMAAGVNTLDLERPIVAQEGDYYGYRIESAAAANFFARKRSFSYAVTDISPGCSDYNWEAKTRLAWVLPIELQMPAPLLVSIGDGWGVVGNLDLRSFLEPIPTKRPGGDVTAYLGEQWRVTRQNMGLHYNNASKVAARFTTDVVNLRPRLALIAVSGVLDMIVGLPTTQEMFLGYWQSMLDACQAHGIKPLVLLTPPLNILTPAQCERLERWNAALRELARGYAGAVVIDVSAYVSAARPGGPPNNRWNLDKAYAYGDQIHLNDAGVRRVVQAIVDQYTEP